MVKWNDVIEITGIQPIVEFASNKLSGKKFEKMVRFTDISGSVRNLIRENGVNKARNIARKALRRRNVQV